MDALSEVLSFLPSFDGRALLRAPGDGKDIVEATAGDVLFFPHDHLHVLGTDLRLTATCFVCGYLSCNRRLCQPLLKALSQMLRISLGEDPTSGWIAELLRLGVKELLAQRSGLG